MFIIDHSESEICKERCIAQLKRLFPDSEIKLVPWKKILNPKEILNYLKTPWDLTVLCTYDSKKTRILPWFLALSSLHFKSKTQLYSWKRDEWITSSRFTRLIKSITKILSDIFHLSQQIIKRLFLLQSFKKRTLSTESINSPFFKILFLRADAYVGMKIGGSVGHLAGVINSMTKKGHQVDLFSSDCLEEVDYSKNITLHESQVFPGWNIPLGGGSISTDEKVTKNALQKFEIKKNASLIYHRYHLGSLGAILLKKKFKIPLILEYNGSEAWIRMNWGTGKSIFDRLFVSLENTTLKHADVIVVVSDILKDQLIERGFDSSKIISVPNGVDENKFDPTTLEKKSISLKKSLGLEGKKVIGFVGTFGQWHGTTFYANVINQIVENSPDSIHFLMIGDGDLRLEFENTLTEKGRSFITLTGRLPQQSTPAYMNLCDAFVSPHIPNPDGTRFFGSPTKLFEYMALEKPIFASNLEQLGEIIEDRKTGVLLEPNHIDEWVNEILNWLNHPNEYSLLGKQARQVLTEKYTWMAHWNKIEEKIKERC
tara:strand:+ start:6981 stop:8606 length:1626 start_codon:yes stop_codon:yes gene_type:complete